MGSLNRHLFGQWSAGTTGNAPNLWGLSFEFRDDGWCWRTHYVETDAIERKDASQVLSNWLSQGRNLTFRYKERRFRRWEKDILTLEETEELSHEETVVFQIAEPYLTLSGQKLEPLGQDTVVLIRVE